MGDTLDVEQFTGETLGCADNTPEELAKARRAVERRIPEGRYREEVLDALFGPARRISTRGSRRSQEWRQARLEWLGRCRDWVESELGRILAASQIPAADQAAYQRATGDVWAPPVSSLPPGPVEPQPCGTDAAYQRHLRYGEEVDEPCRVAATRERAARRARASGGGV